MPQGISHALCRRLTLAGSAVCLHFMTQRIKPPQSHDDKQAMEKYNAELALLHGMLLHAMKAKQTTDLEQTKALSGLIDRFEKSYLKK